MPTRSTLDSGALFQALFENASMAIIIIDQSGQIRLINQKAEEIFGYDQAELAGETMEILLPERYRRVHHYHRSHYTERPHDRPMGVGLDLAGRRKDGSEFPLEIALSYITTETGMLIISFVTDITERFRTQNALRQYARRLEAMQEIEQAVLAARSSDDIARVALRHLRQLVPYQQASVVLFDPLTDHALLLASTLDGEQFSAHPTPVDSAHFPHRATLHTLPYHLEQDPATLAATALPRERHSPTPEARLEVPLVAQGELIGLLRLDAEEVATLTQIRIDVAREVGTQLAVAIQQARLREDMERHATALEARVVERTHEIERRREVAEGLRDILATLNSDRSLAEILDYIVALAGRLLGSEASAIYQLHSPGAPLRIVAARGLSSDYVEQVQLAVGQGAVGQAVAAREPVAVSDLLARLPTGQEDPTLHQVLSELAERYRSLLAVPLIVKEEVYGSIVLYYADPRRFSQEEVDLAVTFADQAALAVENARLRTQVEESAIAAERTRLARELHDAVTQTLFSASLIAEVLPRLWERNPEVAQQRLADLRQLTRGALAEMRTLLFELRPAALIQAELGELLQQLGEAAATRLRIPVTVTLDGDYPLPPEAHLSLYRIAQEGLNNVIKHARAQQATLSLRCVPQPEGVEVTLALQDDGNGFDPATVPGKRLGLAIMRERAATIGASLHLDTAPGQGTTLTVTWLAPHEEQAYE